MDKKTKGQTSTILHNQGVGTTSIWIDAFLKELNPELNPDESTPSFERDLSEIRAKTRKFGERATRLCSSSEAV